MLISIRHSLPFSVSLFVSLSLSLFICSIVGVLSKEELAVCVCIERLHAARIGLLSVSEKYSTEKRGRIRTTDATHITMNKQHTSIAPVPFLRTPHKALPHTALLSRSLFLSVSSSSFLPLPPSAVRSVYGALIDSIIHPFTE